MKHLIIGRGEIGSVLEGLMPKATVAAHDPPRGVLYEGPARIIHICFPWSREFLAETRAYQEKFRPDLTIVHSTVPVGTSDQLGACHSPVRGPATHEMLAFIKYFGGYGAAVAAREFDHAGFRTEVLADARTTEALKLWDSVQYGVFITMEKEIHRWCAANGLDFDLVYTAANQTYNEGYEMLGLRHVKKPILDHVPGPIGGHCVVQNAALLDSWLAHAVVEENED